MTSRPEGNKRLAGRGPAPRLILVLALFLLASRNIPLGFIMPLGSFGDELGHLDCALKWGRGHVPQAMDRLEPELFELYQAHWDHRYYAREAVPALTHLDQLGLGGYTYQAKHPPAVYLIMALFLKIFKALGASLILQLRLFRLLSLAAAAGGILVLSAALRRAGFNSAVFHAPLLFMGLLANDIFFAVNTDTFSFLFGSLVLAGILTLVRNASNRSGWILITAGTILMMGAKASNALVFGWCALLGWVLWRRGDARRALRAFLVSLLLALLLSSPWYVYNQVRFGNPAYFDYGELSRGIVYRPAGLTVPRIVEFVEALTRTLFRGEMFWNGEYFDLLAGAARELLLTVIPAAVFLLGLFASGRRRRSLDEEPAERDARTYLAAAGGLTVAGLMAGFFFFGATPYYQIRLSLGLLYPMLFVFALGWKVLVRRSAPAVWVPAGLLLAYNAAHTAAILGKVLAR